MAREEKPNKAMLELEDGKKFFILAKDEVASQCLGKILIVVQRDYIGKS